MHQYWHGDWCCCQKNKVRKYRNNLLQIRQKEQAITYYHQSKIQMMQIYDKIDGAGDCHNYQTAGLKKTEKLVMKRRETLN